MAVHELGEAQRGCKAECGRWQQAHMPIIKTELLELIYGGGSEPLVKLGSVLAIGTELARDKAFDWAMVTTKDPSFGDSHGRARGRRGGRQG